jgi:hypothetical protein
MPGVIEDVTDANRALLTNTTQAAPVPSALRRVSQTQLDLQGTGSARGYIAQ